MARSSSSIIQKWKRLESTIVFEHPRMTLVEDTVQLPSGKIVKYLHQHYSSNGGVIIVCIKDDKILLQQEYSYPVNEVLYQFPGGRIEDNETCEDAAKRELAEESQLTIEKSHYLGWFYPDNRRTNAKLHVVFSDAVLVDESKAADDEEFIKTMWLPIVKFKEMIAKNEINNYSVLAAWALVLAQLEIITFN